MEIRINKANAALNVDVAKFSPAIMEYVIRYGLTQCLNDAHSTINAKEADAAEKALVLAEKKLDALMRGEVRIVATRTSDPVAQEALRFAKGVIANAAKAQGKTPSAAELTKLAGDYLAKHPEVREAAKATIAARDAAMGDVDLSGI